MVNVNIICVGKIKEKYIKMGMDEFLKRMNLYAKVKIIEAATPICAKEGSIAMVKQQKAISRVLNISTLLRPCLSPKYPNTKPPNGLSKKVVQNEKAGSHF